MAEEDAADRASQEIKALLRRLDPKGMFCLCFVFCVIPLVLLAPPYHYHYYHYRF